MNSIKKLVKEQQSKILEDFFTFLKYPSISSEPPFKSAVIECAQWLVEQIKDLGFEVEVWPTKGYPVIYASNLKAGPKQPTLLFYNHYDVQPVDPLEEWNSPPFEPTMKDGKIYARGAQDNKGQCFYVLQALRLLISEHETLPVNIKWCIEGEEEIGSIGLSALLPSKKSELKADYLAIVDVGIPDEKTPAVTLGTRGIITLDVEMQCSHSDMHSGSHGGIALNPIHALVKLLSDCRDSQGKITIPGFYDDVIPLSQDEKSLFSCDFNEEIYRNETGAKPVGGELDLPALERNWFRPTLEINGIWGGYTGNGFKTVIPAKAYAKISCRLVPDQDPKKIGQSIAEHLKSQTPAGAILKVNIHDGMGEAMRVNPSSKIVHAFSNALEQVFNSPCKKILCGASIPIVPELAKIAEAETILIGLGLSTDNIHAPNEHFSLDRLEKGIEMIAFAIKNLKNSSLSS